MNHIIDKQLDEIYWDSDIAPIKSNYERNKRLYSILVMDKPLTGKRASYLRPVAVRTTQEIAAELEDRAMNHRPRGQGRLRYETLVKYNSTCLLCGASPRTGAQVDVDHIKSISKYPELVNDPDNLQVLCHRCNTAKYNRTEDDFR